VTAAEDQSVFRNLLKTASGWISTSRRALVVRVPMRTLTGLDAAVIDAPDPRTEVVLVAFAIRAPALTWTGHTSAGFDCRHGFEFHWS
jgi:hypothetical protein